MILADVLVLLGCLGVILLLMVVTVLWAIWFWYKIDREAREYHADHAPLTTWQRRKLASDVGWQRMTAEIEQEAEQHAQEYDDTGPLAS